MKTYTAESDAQARGLHDGSIGELVIPCEPTIEIGDGFVYGGNCAGSVEFLQKEPVRFFDPCLYQPGDRIAVKGRWATCWCYCPGCPGYVYPDELGWNTRTTGKQRTPESMPLKAVRTYLVCESVACREQGGQWSWAVKVKREGD